MAEAGIKAASRAEWNVRKQLEEMRNIKEILTKKRNKECISAKSISSEQLLDEQTAEEYGPGEQTAEGHGSEEQTVEERGSGEQTAGEQGPGEHGSVEQTAEKSPEKPPSAARRIKGILTNLIGILLAFGIAGGGLFLVGSRLAEEEEMLLQGGGVVEILREDTEPEVQTADAVEYSEKKLTEEELRQATGSVRGAEEIYPHEPRPGQLAMVDAVELGRQWTEDFFMAHLGVTEDYFQEYKISCSLWAPKWDPGEVQQDLLSYWLVDFSGSEMEVVLYMNAVTGQILSATVQCFFPAEYLENGDLLTLLGDYADSFGIYLETPMVTVGEGPSWEEGWTACQSIGNMGITANLAVSSVVVAMAPSTDIPSSGEADYAEYEEYFVIHLYLEAEGE